MTIVHLNEAQQQAVEYRGGPLLVLAGAGSGKTSVLTRRLAHSVEHHGIRPHRILAVTFTNRAAGEMRRRVAQLLGAEPAGLWIGTFHSLAARMLRREAARLGFTSGFTIYDEDDRLAAIKRLLEQGGYAVRAFPPRAIQSVISTAKNRMIPPEELAGVADDRFARVAAEIYHGLQTVLERANAMDFDDLLLHPLRLFREHPDRLAYYQRRFDSILVDEFQDTNRAQYLLVRQLAVEHREICVVGDDDQSIYSWRGADVRNMLDFETDFPDAKIVRLEENYRSTQIILDVANAVIAENRERLGKTLFTSRTAGDPIVFVTAADERDEAEWLAREFRERTATDGLAYGDMAVLYRTNAQSRAFEEAFRRSAVPYRVVGSVGFYERREVKDLVAYLRLVVNPADDEAFLRAVQIPKRGIGIATLRTLQGAAIQWKKPLLPTAAIADRIADLRPHAMKQLTEFASLFDRLRQRLDDTTPAALLEDIIGAIGYDAHLAAEGPEGMERLENVRELLAAAAEWSEEVGEEDAGSPLEQFLATSALVQVGDVNGDDTESITLMTVHTAKGLEWPVVALVGMEEGLFPLSRALDTPEGTEEERRLAYVALTRPKDRVYVTWARARRRGGQLLPGAPSRFLEALPPHLVDERRTSGVFGGEYRRPRASSFGWMVEEDVTITESQDAPRYVKGERVRHRTFGSGTIRALDGHGRNLKVVIEFDDGDIGSKQLLVAYAGLERDWDSA
jgi:DNA helicase-2/ATP-dependent DNA helicase PcrA